MKPLEELKNILCECESVKKDVMELRFGTNVGIYNYKTDSYLYGKIVNTNEIQINDLGMVKIENYPFIKNTRPELDNFIDGDKGYTKIIGNNLYLHHLMMYCNEKYKGLDAISIGQNGDIYQPSIQLVIIRLDITKPLYKQSDEVLEKIYNFLKG